MRALGIHTPGESSLQASTISSLGPDAFPSGVDPDDTGANPQEAPAELMMVFAVVGCIRQYGSQIHSASGLDQRGSEVRGIVAGTPADLSRKPQMAGGVAGNRELGVIGVSKEPRVRPLREVMKAGLANLQAR